MIDEIQPETSPPPSPPRRLLPPPVTHPLTLLLAIAVPQCILLLLNVRSYYLISGEVNRLQKQLSSGFLAAELIMLIGGSLFALWLWKRKKLVHWAWNWLILVPPIIYLAFFTVKINAIVPPAMSVWIVPTETMTFYQFVFLMPAIFLSALGLACFPVRVAKGRDIGASLAATAGIPLFWYIAIHVGQGHGIERFPAVVIVLLVAASSLVCLAGVLRLLTLLFTWALGKGSLGQAILVALVSIAAPIGGLLLNRVIPFPADFQIWPIYVLTILNGLFLTIPKLNRPKADMIIWILQCALFPFTLYFFFIFLPYLPMAAIAIIAAGAGFLILSPTALFVLHLRKIHRGFPGRRLLPLGVLATLTLPLYAQVEMMIDRAVLHRAIDYVYAPDLANNGRFSGNRTALKRSLVRLQRVKDGVYLPFLTEWYREVVLDGLVLNDEKTSHLHTTFFGSPIPQMESKSVNVFGWRASPSSRPLPMTPPSKDAILKGFSHSTTSDPDKGTRTLVKLELFNPSSRQSEFTTTIHLPEGALVSGYWLHIGDERVPGRIFEKKTAMWIYRMIRDATRRDPGLLTYLAPDRLSLRVFPLEPQETRITEIEFLSPPGHSPALRIGESILPGENLGSGLVTVKSPNSRQSLFVSADAAAKLPNTVREPYFHFVVDRSATGLTAEGAISAMKEVAKARPDILHFTFSAANYEFIDADPALNSLASLGDADLGERIDSLPRRGAFLAELSMQRALGRFRIRQAKSENPADLLRVPLFVLISGPKTPEPVFRSLEWYHSATPDMDGFYEKVHGRADLIARRFDGGETADLARPKAVALFSSGKSKSIIPVDGNPVIANFDSREAIAIFDPGSGKFGPLVGASELSAENDYSRAIAVRNLDDVTRWDPSKIDALLPATVATSRDTGILTPSTAYIVVENSAQWKMLKRKEKEKLHGNQALDFMEAPEPPLLLLVVIFGVYFFVRRRAKGASKNFAMEP